MNFLSPSFFLFLLICNPCVLSYHAPVLEIWIVMLPLFPCIFFAATQGYNKPQELLMTYSYTLIAAGMLRILFFDLLSLLCASC
jgi:hypothetical protein